MLKKKKKKRRVSEETKREDDYRFPGHFHFTSTYSFVYGTIWIFYSESLTTVNRCIADNFCPDLRSNTKCCFRQKSVTLPNRFADHISSKCGRGVFSTFICSTGSGTVRHKGWDPHPLPQKTTTNKQKTVGGAHLWLPTPCVAIIITKSLGSPVLWLFAFL